MNWLRDNAFLATWLALPVAIFIAFFQAKKSGFENIDWATYVLTFAFLSSLAVVFTPVFDQNARYFAEFVAAMTLGRFIYGSGK